MRFCFSSNGRRAVSLLASLVACVQAGAAPSPEKPSARLWAEMAANDVRALHAMLADSHPGAVDPLHGDMHAWLERGLPSALKLADQATTVGGLEYSLRFFADGFNDGHVIVYPKVTFNDAQYPGFIVALREDRFVVIESTVTSIAVGGEIKACDGRDVRDLYRDNVLHFFGVEGVKADYIGFSSWLFADLGNPYSSRPVRCEFRSGAQTTDVELPWQSIERPLLLAKLHDAAYGVDAERGFSEWHPKQYWIGLPRFQFTRDSGDVGTQAAQMTALIESVAGKAAELREASVIVFDVRGNHGGSAHWGDRMLESIWGDGFVSHLKHRELEGIDWRVSDANIAANERYLASFRKTYGAEDGMVKYYEQLVADMKEARSQGKTLMRERDHGSEAQPGKGILRHVKPRVILLSNGTCVSACNDFADAVLSIEGAQLWGADAGADTLYIENRGQDLPSGLFRVSLPMKVFRGRARGNNEAYPAVRRWANPPRSLKEAQDWVDGQLGAAAAATH